MVSSIRGASGYAVRTIPVTIVTGFLGSGKTTLLRKLLVQPAWGKVAVLVNELGEIGLDHDLMWGASGTTVLLENGCVCCSVRDDLVEALESLFWQRLQRRIPAFDRVVIETTGIADPGALVGPLFSHPLIAERYRLDAVVCTVDAQLGAAQLQSHAEARGQVASADALLLTKTDLAAADDVASLTARLHAINPYAPVREVVAGDVSVDALERLVADSGADGGATRSGLDTAAAQADEHEGDEGDDGDDEEGSYPGHRRIRSFALRFTRPWTVEALDAALQHCIAAHGDAILRVKGVVTVEPDGKSLLVQGMQHTIFPHEVLAQWHGAHEPGFLVFIVRGVSVAAVKQAFASHLTTHATHE